MRSVMLWWLGFGITVKWQNVKDSFDSDGNQVLLNTVLNTMGIKWHIIMLVSMHANEAQSNYLIIIM